jgi:hypothetical protein
MCRSSGSSYNVCENGMKIQPEVNSEGPQWLGSKHLEGMSMDIWRFIPAFICQHYDTTAENLNYSNKIMVLWDMTTCSLTVLQTTGASL